MIITNWCCGFCIKSKNGARMLKSLQKKEGRQGWRVSKSGLCLSIEGVYAKLN